MKLLIQQATAAFVCVTFFVRKRGCTAELALVLFQEMSTRSLFFEPMTADIGRSLHLVSYLLPVSLLYLSGSWSLSITLTRCSARGLQQQQHGTIPNGRELHMP